MPARLTWLKDLVAANKRIKLLSLVLAAISWYAIRDATSFEIVVRDIRVEPQYREGMAVLHQSATTVDVTFLGSQDDIRKIDPSQIKAVVDLRSAGAGTEEITLGPGNIEGERGVRPVQVTPGKLKVTLDREDEKMVRVTGTYAGKPLLGQVDAVACEPEMVRLRGPARKLDTTEAVYTAPVDVDGRIESFAKRSPVLPPSDTWGARIEPPDVQVRIDIAQKASQREFRDVAVLVMTPPGGAAPAELLPAKVNVTLFGRSEVLDAVQIGTVKVLADCSGLSAPGGHDVPTHVYVPPEIEVSAVADPKTVHVVLR